MKRLQKLDEMTLAMRKQTSKGADSDEKLMKYWYMCMLGARRAYQGQGVGRALIGCVTSAALDDGMPAYLETTSENTSIFEQYRFEVAEQRCMKIDGQESTLGDLFGMVRPAYKMLKPRDADVAKARAGSNQRDYVRFVYYFRSSNIPLMLVLFSINGMNERVCADDVKKIRSGRRIRVNAGNGSGEAVDASGKKAESGGTLRICTSLCKHRLILHTPMCHSAYHFRGGFRAESRFGFHQPSTAFLSESLHFIF